MPKRLRLISIVGEKKVASKSIIKSEFWALIHCYLFIIFGHQIYLKAWI